MNLADILDLVVDAPTRAYSDGDRLLQEGERSAAIHVLVEGELEVVRRGRAVVRIAEPGAIVGELGLLLDEPATADVVAVGPVTVHHVEGGDELFTRYPALMGHLATMLARRLQQISTYLTDLQEQFAGQSATLGLVPNVLRELLDSQAEDLDTGSDRERDSPY